MILGRIVGDVTATRKHESLRGRTLLVVQPLTAERKAHGSRLVAVDCVQSGPGDIVLVCDEGNAARLILQDSTAPVRTVVVGIVDSVTAGNLGDKTEGS
jgi:microcompartment protein CcmK/EutM